MKPDEKTIDEYVENFICYKRSLGYDYVTPSYYIKKYALYINNNPKAEIISKASVDGFLMSLTDSPSNLYQTGCVLREFGKYMAKQGIASYILRPKMTRRSTPEPPYFFTDEEIEKFFSVADSMAPLGHYPGREIIIPTLFRLMYCCGVRCKEARTLLRKNVSFEEHFIDIMASKGSKDRRIYINDELTMYLENYDQTISARYQNRTYFFPGYRNDGHLSESSICGNFRRCWKTAFPDFPEDAYPRAYDLRHHFAWSNINKWASEGLDVNVMLPYLMKYMGHVSVKQTLYYFHFVPDFYPTYRQMAATLEDIFPEVPE